MSDEREGDELVEKLTKLAEKKECEPPPELTKDVVINLAGMTPLQYAQQLSREAKKYRTPLRLLEKAVEEVRVEQATESLLMPHWQVTPIKEEADIAGLLADIWHRQMPPRHSRADVIPNLLPEGDPGARHHSVEGDLHRHQAPHSSRGYRPLRSHGRCGL
jgi:hypothetical protein